MNINQVNIYKVSLFVFQNVQLFTQLMKLLVSKHWQQWDWKSSQTLLLFLTSNDKIYNDSGNEWVLHSLFAIDIIKHNLLINVQLLTNEFLIVIPSKNKAFPPVPNYFCYFLDLEIQAAIRINWPNHKIWCACRLSSSLSCTTHNFEITEIH